MDACQVLASSNQGSVPSSCPERCSSEVAALSGAATRYFSVAQAPRSMSLQRSEQNGLNGALADQATGA